MNKQKNKKQNPFAPYLWTDEEILWQGRPNATLKEYLEKKPSLIDSYTEGELLEHPLVEQEKKYRGCVCWAWFILAVMISLTLFPTLGFLFMLFVVPDLTLPIPFVIGMSVVVGFMAFILLAFPILNLGTRINGILEWRWVAYAVTNRRVMVKLRWALLYLSHDELDTLEFEQGKFGTHINWGSHNKKLSRVQALVPPFLGLNDFDVQEVIKHIEANRVKRLKKNNYPFAENER